jgi:GxxExxY protein
MRLNDSLFKFHALVPPVRYKDERVGDYAADLWVENLVLVELKVAPEYQTADEAQLLNELKATGLKVGLLINFGRTKVQFKRWSFSQSVFICGCICSKSFPKGDRKIEFLDLH